jgi:hypothetical protein
MPARTLPVECTPELLSVLREGRDTRRWGVHVAAGLTVRTGVRSPSIADRRLTLPATDTGFVRARRAAVVPVPSADLAPEMQACPGTGATAKIPR